MVAEVIQISESKKQIQRMNQIFSEQKAAFRKNPMPSYQERVANLKKLRSMLLDNQDEIIETISSDFSNRSADETKLAELMTTIHGIDYNIKNLKSWMSKDKKKISPLFQPATGFVQYQPLGIIGIISPWNYTVSLSMGPLVAALAAGNRSMIKMSEFTPQTSALIEQLISDTFPQDLVAIVQGDAEVATEFSSIPWNHLLFTGSTAVGRHVMKAAAANLTPVTLELGGKSPTIISDDVNMDDATQSIVFGKAFNAGQTCIAPDYILCPEHRLEHFVDRFQHFFAKMYPTLKHNTDFTSVVDERQLARLQSYLDDAKSKGATIIECNPADEDMQTGTRKMPIHLVLNATDDMLVMQEELFGPILPILPTKSLDQALDFINDRPQPLALYYFGMDKDEQQYVLEQVRAGGVCINDTVSHFAQEDLHFGGVGESGMGSYHGEQGFLTFSHAKSVFCKNHFNSTKFAYPPFGTLIHKALFSIFLR
ncbi:coniferyl-aldehyde dehydrogenase [Oleiphilus sp. HI0043]|jgi:coniferyl-aldehyde dehydrogenase|nr:MULTISPECIES: coniferyl aldehyde dehydrogenase [unclassified Oleiphilus]KZY30675.1 coniferyl-aldehyde dehydrogenase [Oleiphilus sp. HI0043]KZZ64124.1 coniferyl-aldehyde dehydrogenase [Oleiphilus sp. HI0128]